MFSNEKEDFPLAKDSINIPQFGNSSSDYDEVVAPFYSFWLVYQTPQRFAFVVDIEQREQFIKERSKDIQVNENGCNR